MDRIKNPFEYDAAVHLPDELILQVFVEDNTFTRFIQSKRNIMLHGERGSGKSMTLLYNSFGIQRLRATRLGEQPNYNNIGVYIPCNTALNHKLDHLLIQDAFQQRAISEHFLVLQVVSALAETLQKDAAVMEGAGEARLRQHLSYQLSADLPQGCSFAEVLRLYVGREANRSQTKLQSEGGDLFYTEAVSFASLVYPILALLRQFPKLRATHFMLMFDDAHCLNSTQRRILNSWIAFRDQSLFSFKVAAARTPDWDYLTSAGGTILEGHDFLTIDLERPFQSAHSSFGRLARDIVNRRLSLMQKEGDADQFFPFNPSFREGLEQGKQRARELAEQKYGPDETKKIADFVYKYGSVFYFRERHSKANLPPYSGFETIVQLSTGVVRNLLEPCYWMYDDAVSRLGADAGAVVEIDSTTQANVIKARSEALWARLEEGLDRYVVDCSREDAIKLRHLFDALAGYFRERLLRHRSEPRVVQFSISGITPELEERLMPLLDIARRALLLYVRLGPAKAGGRRERFYVPNRMLWPARGLDPLGQHGRASLKAADLLAATTGRDIPFDPDEPDGSAAQRDLFNE